MYEFDCPHTDEDAKKLAIWMGEETQHLHLLTFDPMKIELELKLLKY